VAKVRVWEGIAKIVSISCALQAVGCSPSASAAAAASIGHLNICSSRFIVLGDFIYKKLQKHVTRRSASTV
jgi:hypothetical protein